MLALVTSVAIFAFFLLLGASVIGILRPALSEYRALLLSPAVGVSLSILIPLLLNQSGLPIRSFGVYFVIFSTVLGALALIKNRATVRFVSPGSLMYALPLVLLLALVGRPFLDYGFDWLSYSNDDMANYVLSATRLLNFPFYHIPTLREVYDSTDPSQFFWFSTEFRSERVGSELLIALGSSASGRAPFEIFMPLIVALTLALSAAVGALATSRLSALIVMFAVAISALVALGTMAQLIGQVLGLTFLAAICAVIAPSYLRSGAKPNISIAVVLSVLVAGDCIAYPETLPFALVASAVVLAHRVLTKKIGLKGLAKMLALSGLLAVILLNHNLAILYAVLHYRSANQNIGSDLLHSGYPYYFIPSGLANYWGLIPYPVTFSEPFQSMAIGAGAVALVALCFLSIRETFKGSEGGAITLVMLIVSVILVGGRKDFESYKIAMYMSPFGLAVIVDGVSGLRVPYMVTLAMLFMSTSLFGLYSEYYYVECSRDLATSKVVGFIEVKGASNSKILEELSSLASTYRQVPTVITDSDSGTLSKYENSAFRGFTFINPNHIMERFAAPGQQRLSFETFKQADIDQHFYTRIAALLADAQQLEILPPKSGAIEDAFIGDRRIANSCLSEGSHLVRSCKSILLLLKGAKLTIFNRFGTRDPQNFRANLLSKVRNALLPIGSIKAPLMAAGYASAVAPLERDYFYSGKTFAAINSRIFVQVVRPSPHVRVLLSLCDSLNNDGSNRLPRFDVLGEDRRSFGIVGRGSARVISDAVAPEDLDGGKYLELQTNDRSFQFRPRRTGLMGLYGNGVSLDPRSLVGFARDISLLSEEQYRAIRRPSGISRFPTDLADSSLEYSGIYEDGWISERAFVVIHSGKRSKLTISGSVPDLGHLGLRQTVKIVVDGRQLAFDRLSDGHFEIVEGRIGEGDHRVSLWFSSVEKLPGNDMRPVAAKLDRVAFTN